MLKRDQEKWGPVFLIARASKESLPAREATASRRPVAAKRSGRTARIVARLQFCPEQGSQKWTPVLG